MNKETYLQELRKGLKILPQFDRDEAIEFYEEYFDEAGVENEAKVIEELGDPKALAKKILVDVVDRKYEETMAASNANTLSVIPAAAGAAGATAGAAAFGTEAVQGGEIPQAAPNVEPAFNAQPVEEAKKSKKKSEQPSALKTLWIVLAAIFALPLSPVIFALLIVACVLVFVLFIVLISFLMAGFGIFVAGVGTTICGIAAIFMNPVAATVILGSGLTCFGLGIFFMMGSLALIRLCAGALAKGFGRIVHKRNRKNKAEQAA